MVYVTVQKPFGYCVTVQKPFSYYGHEESPLY